MFPFKMPQLTYNDIIAYRDACEADKPGYIQAWFQDFFYIFEHDKKQEAYYFDYDTALFIQHGANTIPAKISVLKKLLIQATADVSRNQLFEDDKEMKKLFKGKIFTANTLDEYLPLFTLPYHLNIDPLGIHFINGRFNLATLELEKRKFGQCISKYIDYKYEIDITSDDYYNEFYCYLLKIIPEEGALDFLCYQLAKALVGSDEDNCHFFSFIGKGSSGKTTLLHFLYDCFTKAYCCSAPVDAFGSIKNPQRYFNTLEPQYRFVLLNEPQANCNSNVMKTFCDGELECSTLYENGWKSVKTVATLIITSNDPLTFSGKDQTGILRRMLDYTCNSKFTYDDNVDETKRIYKAETCKFKNESNIIKSARFYFFARYAPWILNPSQYEPVPRPVCFRNAETVRTFQSFIEEMFSSCPGNQVPLADFLLALAYYFPTTAYSDHEIRKEIKKLPAIYNIEYKNTIKMKFVKNVEFNLANVQRLENKEPLIPLEGPWMR